jgi:hypothetical protein
MQESLWNNLLGTRKRSGQGLRLPTSVGFLVPVLLLLFLLPLPLLADTVYSYTGPSYQTSSAPYAYPMNITGTMTLPTPLPPDTHGIAVHPTSFSFSDGVQTITNLNATYNFFSGFTTDENGNITSWIVTVKLGTAEISTIRDIGDFATTAVGTEAAGKTSEYPHGGWTTVPEVDPASSRSALALIAGFALVFRGRRKKKPEPVC